MSPLPPILTKTDDALEVSFGHLRGGSFQDALVRVKAIPGRKFDFERKVWLLPADATTAERALNSLQPEADASLVDWVRNARVQEASELTTSLPTDAELKWPKAGPVGFVPDENELRKRLGLFPHQRSGIDFIAERARALLGDDMGVGKTAQMIGGVEEWRLRNLDVNGVVPHGPKLVVCPNSVKGSWYAEIEAWLGAMTPIRVIHGNAVERNKQLKQAIAEDAWAIINYEQLRVTRVEVKRKNGSKSKKWVMKEPLFQKTKWLAAMLDEAHRIKNQNSLQARGAFRVDANVKIAATGTPLSNHPGELWALLKWLFPKEYTSYWDFFEMYVDYYESSYNHKEIVGVKNPDALRFELKDRLIRRTKDEILDLPEKMRRFVPVEMTGKQRTLYEEAETQMWVEVKQAAAQGDKSAQEFIEAVTEVENDPSDAARSKFLRIVNGAARTVRLRQILETPANIGGEDVSAKLDATVEIITDAQPNQFGVFCEFVPTTTCLIERLRKKGLTAEVYRGDVTPEERTLLEQQFQLGKIDVLVGTIATMKEGITLHSANESLWVSRHWNPSVNEQGEDRFHRIGQRHPVTNTILEVPDTVDVTKVRPKNQTKERIVKTVIKKDHIEEQED